MSEVDERELGKISGEARTAECDSCGGNMIYDPENKKLKCQFCGHLEEIELTKDNVLELNTADMHNNDFNWDITAKVIECKNCGGQTITEPSDETSYCSYCGSQHIIERTDQEMGMKPQGIVPYEFSNEKARIRMKKWVSKRYLAPRDLKERFLNKNLKGIYMPYWTFDSSVNATYRVRIGEYYYTGVGDKRKRHTKWRNYSGERRKFYDDVLVSAISHDQSALLKKIEPFNTKKGKVLDYKSEFLAGYQARKYTVMPEVAIKIAQEDMARDIEHEVKRNLPGDTNESYKQSVVYSRESYKHILLPVYMTAYEYKQKIYHVLINGQTGEVQGKSPVSPVKVALLVALGVIIAGTVWMLSRG